MLSFPGILRYPQDSHPNLITREQRGNTAPELAEARKKEAREQRLQWPVNRSCWKLCIIVWVCSYLFQRTLVLKGTFPRRKKISTALSSQVTHLWGSLYNVKLLKPNCEPVFQGFCLIWCKWSLIAEPSHVESVLPVQSQD